MNPLASSSGVRAVYGVLGVKSVASLVIDRPPNPVGGCAGAAGGVLAPPWAGACPSSEMAVTWAMSNDAKLAMTTAVNAERKKRDIKFTPCEPGLKNGTSLFDRLGFWQLSRHSFVTNR